MQSAPPFHIAITMAGAVSAGAYTAGVIDYLFSALDRWDRCQKEAVRFYEIFPELENLTWDELETHYFSETELARAADFDENWRGLETADLEQAVRRAAMLYAAVPRHRVQIEILSGASAGGMTAAIGSLVLHLPEKHSIDLDGEKIDRKKNRLYNSWVELAADDMMPILFGVSDIETIRRQNPKIRFPVSLLNSQFIRAIARDAFELNEKEKQALRLPDYVAGDFCLFVTMTNLNGYQRTVRLDSGDRQRQDIYPSDFITYDHRDLAMFSFGERPQKGSIPIDFRRDSETIKLLRAAAVSTGAFPVGLEYGFLDVETKYIRENFLIRKMYDDIDDVLTTVNYRSAMIDGGLINNEPFELTEDLLIHRLKNIYPVGKEDDLKKLRNYTVILIDPFPSEKRKPKTLDGEDDEISRNYPYDFFEAIGKLLAAVRSQLLVKPKLMQKAFDEADFTSFVIAPKRRVFRLDERGRPIKKNGRYQPKYEVDEHRQMIADRDGNPIPSVYNGSLAIASGALAGFGGFLDKNFRKHDFRLGQINCKSFLRNHFRFVSVELEKNEVFRDAYPKEAAEIFHIIDHGRLHYPIIPDIAAVEAVLDGKCSKNDIKKRTDIEELYGSLVYPKYDMAKFDALRKSMFRRLDYLLMPYIENMLAKHFFGKMMRPLARRLFRFGLNKMLFDKIRSTVEKQLCDWQLVKKEEER